MAALSGLMAQVSIEMKAALAKARVAFDHNLSKGEAAEEPVRQFLRQHLPASIGVTTGQVIDSRGNRSRQTDVIVYDAFVTPILFSSEEGGHQLVPSEGVIAVIEVKSTLNTSGIDSVVRNMDSVKGLDKSAYYPTDSILTNEVYIYGQRYPICPTLYFVFAYESSNLEDLTVAFRAAHAGRNVTNVVDNICVLGRGGLLHQDARGHFDGVAGPGKALMAADAPEHSLLLFYLLVARWLLQIRFRPLDMLRYIPNDFDFKAGG